MACRVLSEGEAEDEHLLPVDAINGPRGCSVNSLCAQFGGLGRFSLRK
ncbi:hypothetical protein [Streptomyces sp. NPDC029004]